MAADFTLRSQAETNLLSGANEHLPLHGGSPTSKYPRPVDHGGDIFSNSLRGQYLQNGRWSQGSLFISQFLSVLTTPQELDHISISQELQLLPALRLRTDIVILGMLPLQNGLERIHIVQRKLGLVDSLHAHQNIQQPAEPIGRCKDLPLCFLQF